MKKPSFPDSVKISCLFDLVAALSGAGAGALAADGATLLLVAALEVTSRGSPLFFDAADVLEAVRASSPSPEEEVAVMPRG